MFCKAEACVLQIVGSCSVKQRLVFCKAEACVLQIGVLYGGQGGSMLYGGGFRELYREDLGTYTERI